MLMEMCLLGEPSGVMEKARDWGRVLELVGEEELEVGRASGAILSGALLVAGLKGAPGGA